MTSRWIPLLMLLPTMLLAADAKHGPLTRSQIVYADERLSIQAQAGRYLGSRALRLTATVGGEERLELGAVVLAVSCGGEEKTITWYASGEAAPGKAVASDFPVDTGCTGVIEGVQVVDAGYRVAGPLTAVYSGACERSEGRLEGGGRRPDPGPRVLIRVPGAALERPAEVGADGNLVLPPVFLEYLDHGHRSLERVDPARAGELLGVTPGEGTLGERVKAAQARLDEEVCARQKELAGEAEARRKPSGGLRIRGMLRDARGFLRQKLAAHKEALEARCASGDEAVCRDLDRAKPRWVATGGREGGALRPPEMRPHPELLEGR
jgi:hypothetical protein